MTVTDKFRRAEIPFKFKDGTRTLNALYIPYSVNHEEIESDYPGLHVYDVLIATWNKNIFGWVNDSYNYGSKIGTLVTAEKLWMGEMDSWYKQLDMNDSSWSLYSDCLSLDEFYLKEKCR